ncbi:MAG: hypothetical protein WKF79_00035 [Nocardioides sp.]
MSRQFLTAIFAEGGMPYTYHNDGQPVAAGDRVLVNGRGGKGTRAVTVHAADVPQPKFVTKAIIGPSTEPPRPSEPAASPPEGKLL